MKQLKQTRCSSHLTQPTCRNRSSSGGGGAMVLGKLPVPGLPTNLDLRRARASEPAVGAVGVVWTFFLSSVISFFFSLSLGVGPI